RSMNSWLHNLPALAKGRDRCTLQIHPDDARARGLESGGEALLRTRVGELRVPVEVTEQVMPGVVSLPHGWGHDMEGSQMEVAASRAGVNSNLLSTGAMDPLSGNAVLNGIPVEVVPA
ncbi:MAG TPA: molybdopterin dinucleotide binding domain-containing protein, partial [Acidimicrobiia bacterium]|nr:molybdopterin dinucleotide binding domain-containing protein [Acidimicrobiia bacterium]